jgi:hypothetical protein
MPVVRQAVTELVEVHQPVRQAHQPPVEGIAVSKESGEGREAEFEVSLTEARRTRRGEREKGDCHRLWERGNPFFSSSVSSVPPLNLWIILLDTIIIMK